MKAYNEIQSAFLMGTCVVRFNQLRGLWVITYDVWYMYNKPYFKVTTFTPNSSDSIIPTIVYVYSKWNVKIGEMKFYSLMRFKICILICYDNVFSIKVNPNTTIFRLFLIIHSWKFLRYDSSNVQLNILWTKPYLDSFHIHVEQIFFFFYFSLSKVL